jgi:uncharacterized protein YdhG (YjbR/CyaY superfamily)
MTKTTGAAKEKQSASAGTVDEYLAAATEEARSALARLRKTIKAAAPMANESISYQIPLYKHRGHLVAFKATGDRCVFVVMSPALIRAHAAELKGYKLGKASITFSASKPLPAALVTKLVKARIVENESGRSYQERQ